MDRISWDAVASEFEWDGSWRDILVQDTTAADWNGILRLLQESEAVALDPRGQEVQALDNLCESLPVNIGFTFQGLEFVMHVFAPDSVEITVDPRLVRDQGSFDNLVSFMTFLARSADRIVVLTPENGPDMTILKVAPGAVQVEYFPA